jgi:hypothetical protein
MIQPIETVQSVIGTPRQVASDSSVQYPHLTIRKEGNVYSIAVIAMDGNTHSKGGFRYLLSRG